MTRAIVSLSLVVLLGLAQIEAHAFLDRAEPAVGSSVQIAPDEVRIWFSEDLEPSLSAIRVFDPSGKQVDKRDVHLDRLNHALLHVSLPPVESGTYKVIWRVVSADSHVTQGSFTFRVTH